MLKRHLMTETLEQLLRNELLPQQEEDDESGKKRKGLKGLLSKEKKDGESTDE